MGSEEGGLTRMYLISLILSFLSPVSIGHSQSISTPCIDKLSKSHSLLSLLSLIT